MRRLSEIKGEEAIDVLADLMTPVSAILADEEVGKAWKNNPKVADFVALMLKRHKDAVVDVLYILDGTTRKKYLASANVISIMKDALYIMNDEAMKEVFRSQAQNKAEESSGSAMESTEEESN